MDAILWRALDLFVTAFLGVLDPTVPIVTDLRVRYWMWRDAIPSQYVEEVDDVRRLDFGEPVPHWRAIDGWDACELIYVVEGTGPSWWSLCERWSREFAGIPGSSTTAECFATFERMKAERGERGDPCGPRPGVLRRSILLRCTARCGTDDCYVNAGAEGECVR
jgi:hypothetical protein